MSVSYTHLTLAAASNANPDLKWERTAMLNIGLDFSFFGGRLGGTIEYYDKRTSDPVSYTHLDVYKRQEENSSLYYVTPFVHHILL